MTKPGNENVKKPTQVKNPTEKIGKKSVKIKTATNDFKCESIRK